jgi:hypothetical protein
MSVISTFDASALACEKNSRVVLYMDMLEHIVEQYGELAQSGGDPLNAQARYNNASSCVELTTNLIDKLNAAVVRMTAIRVGANVEKNKARSEIIALIHRFDPPEAKQLVVPPPDAPHGGIIVQRTAAQIVAGTRILQRPGSAQQIPRQVQPDLVVAIKITCSANGYQQMQLGGHVFTIGPTVFVPGTNQKQKTQRCNGGRTCPGPSCTYYHDPMSRGGGAAADSHRNISIRWASDQMRNGLATHESAVTTQRRGEAGHEYVSDVAVIGGTLLLRLVDLLGGPRP